MKTEYRRQLLYTFIPALAVLAALLAAKLFFNIRTNYLTGDVTVLGNIHPLAGAISSTGSFLWCATASISGFAAALIYTRRKEQQAFRFLVCASLLSAYLFFDDFFLIHDDLAERYLGLPNHVTYAFLGSMVLAYLVVFRRSILQSHYALFMLAMGFLSFSLLLDVFFEPWFELQGWDENIWEEGAKWLGISCWCSYYVRTSFELVRLHYADMMSMPTALKNTSRCDNRRKERKSLKQTV